VKVKSSYSWKGTTANCNEENCAEAQLRFGFKSNGDAGLLILLGCAITGCRAQSVPKVFEGVWQVSSVLVDTGATRTLRYQNDDDRLKGRILTIGANRVTTDLPEDKLCGGLTRHPSKPRPVSLFAAPWGAGALHLSRPRLRTTNSACLLALRLRRGG